MNTKIHFNRLLRLLRLERCYTQEALAFAAGVSPQCISTLERGTRLPQFFTLAKIAKILDVPLDVFAQCEEQTCY